MRNGQSGILEEITSHSRFISYELQPDTSVEQIGSALTDLIQLADGRNIVTGLGLSLLNALGVKIPGMHNMPVLSGPGFDIPSTPAALWCWIRGEDRGELYHLSRRLDEILFPALLPGAVLDGFKFAAGLDLSGYEDGTENPQGEEAIAAAIVTGQGKGMDGSSFVAVQQWLHDLDVLQDKSEQEQDDIIGRHIRDNEEFDEAPPSAHVKRTAQESYEPAAFMLRRSMPWVDGADAGLNFIAFGKSFEAFEAILNRMAGNEDSIPDALFSFTRPVTGAYFWCPPMVADKLDLSLLGY